MIPKIMAIDRALPGEELVDRQLISVARLLDREKSAANGENDLGLAADDPTLGVGRWKVGHRQRRPIGTHDIADTRSECWLGHLTQYYLDPKAFNLRRLA